MEPGENPPATLEVEIERLLPGGVGLAHAEGLTLFVSLAAPGDTVRVQIDRLRGKVAFASVLEVINPSPVRVEPPCPYFGRCGGCDFQQLKYEAQLQTKLDIIKDCLHRIANIADLPEIPIHPSPKQWQYRARANWQFDPLTRQLGYFEAGSHRVCDVEVCAVLVPDLQNTLGQLRTHIRDDSFPNAVKNVEVVAGDEGVSVTPAWGDFETMNVGRRIGDETYHFSADAFFQVNQDLLVPLVHEATRDARGVFALDLYCGGGLFTIPLSRNFERVIGVESNPTAARFARMNLRKAELKNAKIITALVGEWLHGEPVESKVDFMLLDPPRAGAENIVIKGILARHPQQVSYVSCDPATLARDLKKLLVAGYLLDSVVAFDMFPQTHHVETVVRLTAQH